MDLVYEVSVISPADHDELLPDSVMLGGSRSPQRRGAAIAMFLARLPSPEVSWVDEHLLVIVGGSRNQVVSRPDEPGDQGSGSPDQRQARR